MAGRAIVHVQFRKRIKELRERRHWTQEQVAEACGLDYKLYQFYELGIKDNPGLRTLEKIATGYGLALHELFAPHLPANRKKAGRWLAPRPARETGLV